MNKKHTTADGITMMICQMEDSHLTATIKLMCKGIDDLRHAIDFGDKIKRSERIIYNQKEISIENLEGILKGKIGLLKEYVIEAALRGLPIAEYLQKAFGRATSINLNNNVLSLDIHVDAKTKEEVEW